jgi:phosphatidylglycerol lysyltransferase
MQEWQGPNRSEALNKRSLVVPLIALITLGCGVVNLYSVIGPSLPERSRLLREFFPLEFLHLSRFLTLLIGLALVISSINIYKRKKRAFQIVVLLTSLSVLFHLTKGLDYEEATFSVVLLGILLLSRRFFTVKSSLPSARDAVIRLGLATAAALAYGIAGFWLLDTREFGINFTIGNSIHRTLQFLSLIGDPTIVPHTRYARWFLNSLYLMTASVLGYAGFAVFRPVVYRFATFPHEQDRAREIVARHGRSSMDFFKSRPDKSFFFSPSKDCFLAYRVAGGFAVVLGDPVGPEKEIGPTICEFTEMCTENGWGLAFHQTLPDFLSMYRHLGFRKLKVGDDAIVDLRRFSLEGRDMKKLRSRVNLLQKDGVRAQLYDPPVPDDVLAQAKEVSDEWLRIPGRRERTFTLGQFDFHYLRSTPIFGAFDKQGKMLAFMNILPPCARAESAIDLMRHRIQAPNGSMDFLFVKLFLAEKERGLTRFNLGMAPMSGFQESEQASVEERAVHYFFQRLNFLFSYSGLRQYKAKFAGIWEPRYVVFRTPLDLPRLAMALSRVSGVVD